MPLPGPGGSRHARDVIAILGPHSGPAARVEDLDLVTLSALVRPVAADPEHEIPAAAVAVPEQVSGAVLRSGSPPARDIEPYLIVPSAVLDYMRNACWGQPVGLLEGPPGLIGLPRLVRAIGRVVLLEADRR